MFISCFDPFQLSNNSSPLVWVNEPLKEFYRPFVSLSRLIYLSPSLAPLSLIYSISLILLIYLLFTLSLSYCFFLSYLLSLSYSLPFLLTYCLSLSLTVSLCLKYSLLFNPLISYLLSLSHIYSLVLLAPFLSLSLPLSFSPKACIEIFLESFFKQKYLSIVLTTTT